MLIKYASDLHLEQYYNSEHALSVLGLPGKSDVLVLAGDIFEMRLAELYIDYIKKLAETTKHIIYVAGNHEYWNAPGYKMPIKDISTKFARNYLCKEIQNFIFLDNESITIDNVKFIGSTLWSDLSLLSKKVALTFNKWPDFKYVYKSSIALQTVDNVTKLNATAFKYIRTELDNVNENEKVVIITHFCPANSAMDEKYIGEKYNQFFYNNYDAAFAPGCVFNRPELKAWIYGHTHNSVSKKLAHTQLKCNPRGNYYKVSGTFENPEFTWKSNITV